MNATKLDNLKKKLDFTKFNILWNKAIKEGKITRFEEEIFEKMSNTIIACLPVSLYIKYSNHLFAQGTCYDRSLYMAVVMLVRQIKKLIYQNIKSLLTFMYLTILTNLDQVEKEDWI